MKATYIDPKIGFYVNQVLIRETGVEALLREETARFPEAKMLSSPEVGAMLSLLNQMLGSRKAIEIGTFTGYTAIKIAQGLGPDGRLLCFDVNKEWTDRAKVYWQRAGVDSRISLKLAPARESLEKLLAEGQAGQFDFAFIDADKESYDLYYELCLKLLRQGGLIVLDNMIWSGAVVDEMIQDPSTKAIRALNLKISSDPRVSSCLLTVADGLMLAFKK